MRVKYDQYGNPESPVAVDGEVRKLEPPVVEPEDPTRVNASLEYPVYDWSPSAFQRGKYNSEYADLIKTAADRVANWSYDPANDNSYKVYARQYMRNGANAYEDTLARLASRTGGVASSYAAAAAQQQYNKYMSDLASKVPELEQLAYQRAQNNLNMYTGLDNTAYSRWNDDEERRYKEWAAMQSAAQSAYNQRYNAKLKQYEAQNQKAEGTDNSNLISILKGMKDGAAAYEYLANRGYSGEEIEDLIPSAGLGSAKDAYIAYRDGERQLNREEAFTKLENAPNQRDRRMTLEGLKQSGQIDNSTYEYLYRYFMMDENRL